MLYESGEFLGDSDYLLSIISIIYMTYYSISMLKRRYISQLLRPLIALTRVKYGITALTFHNLSREQFAWFDAVVKFIVENYGVVDPKDFLQNKVPQQTNHLQVLFTFDDGFYSNRLLVEQSLARYNLKALFFLPEGFIGLSGNEAYDFVLKNFFPTKESLKGPKHYYHALSWKDVDWLLTQGHVVGAHARKHLMLSKLTAQQQTEEIIESANRMEYRLGIDVSSFAYPFGSVASVNTDSIRIAAQRFQHSFSNVRGSIIESPNHNFLFRQNLVPGDPLWLEKAMVEGRVDWKYNQERKASMRLMLSAGV